MKKIFTLAAVAALVLSACAKIETEKPVVDEPIAFGAYAGNALTKAGAYGEETTTTLQTNGFGVFAYQTTGAYSKTESKPNFMYNTKVSTASWTYSPVKYWPNQIANGGTDSQNPKAQATQADMVTFFAYAPHVAATAASGAVASTDEGIIALTNNETAGDPKVTYKVSANLDKQVDLLWAVSKGETWTNVAGGTNTPTTGFPYLNLQKPAIGTSIKFYFKHALAQIKLQAVAAYNQVDAGGTAKDDVKITIEQVKLTVPGMTDKMALNLNNTDANTPLWEAVDGSTTSNLELTVATANIVDALKYQGAKVQENTGVTGTAADVITTGKYFTVLPKTGSTAINVEVTYYVTTPDSDLKGGYSQVKNVISHDVTFASGLVAGTKNTILMKLGVSEVKFDAVVDPWADGTDSTVDLPINNN